MNAGLRKKPKNDFEKDFFKLIDKTVFGKAMKNARKNRDTKAVTTERRRNYLVSKPNYHTTKFSTKILLAIEMKKKTQILINKLVYLGLSILQLSKILIYEFWCDHVKPKYGKKAQLSSMDTSSFIVYIKTDDIYKIWQKTLKQDFTLQIMN